MAVILLATILPDLAHGRTDEVKKRLEKLMFSNLMSAAANRGTQFVFGLTALAPFAPILGPAAGMCGWSALYSGTAGSIDKAQSTETLEAHCIGR